MRLHFEEGERELLATRLGLEDGADDAAVAQAVATWMQEDPAASTTTSTEEEDTAASGDIPEGDDIVVVDVSEFNRLRKRDRVAAKIEAAEAIRDRDELIEEAIADGKFAPSRREHYKARYDSDREGTTALIARLTKNTVPLEARGATVPDDEVDDASYPRAWVPEVAARQDQGGQPQRNRVHGEQ